MRLSSILLAVALAAIVTAWLAMGPAAQSGSALEPDTAQLEAPPPPPVPVVAIAS